MKLHRLAVSGFGPYARCEEVDFDLLGADGLFLLHGDTGAGKTTIGLQFALEGARCGEPTLYMNFQENPTQLIRTIRGLGVDLEEAQAQGLDLVYASPVELQIDSIIVDMFRRIQQRGVRRLVARPARPRGRPGRGTWRRADPAPGGTPRSRRS